MSKNIIFGEGNLYFKVITFSLEIKFDKDFDIRLIINSEEKVSEHKLLV